MLGVGAVEILLVAGSDSSRDSSRKGGWQFATPLWQDLNHDGGYPRYNTESNVVTTNLIAAKLQDITIKITLPCNPSLLISTLKDRHFEIITMDDFSQ